MIAMWDELFIRMDKKIQTVLAAGNGMEAFMLMHSLLDRVWQELSRVLVPGGFVCINIGDAARKIGDLFQLYSNHARILQTFYSLNFESLPLILWRKTTNAPNKFMGSGMLPAGAYVTLEHEYILILRKTGRRRFDKPAEKQRRRESAFFWEERNQWFSDTWNLAGKRQAIDSNSRSRSAAFPFELAYRLINMYSVKNDTVLDPFLGTGTTMLAAMCGCRNSVGVEIDPAFQELITKPFATLPANLNAIIDQRLTNHTTFINERLLLGKPIKHQNKPYNFPVMTLQEEELFLNKIDSVTFTEEENLFNVTYTK